ncbi:hypothetical protein CsSME_00008488 [Camellia sinensis var. sinensis]
MEESGGGNWWGVVAKPCDSCKVAAALVFCRVDSVFLCMGCDVAHTRHERVWMCEVCEQAPASVTCKADAAALCVTCDRDIHSANPLSRRHERFPVVPFFDSATASAASSATVLFPAAADEITDYHQHETTAAAATAPSWLIPIGATPKVAGNEPEMKSIELLMSESDQFLDFDHPISINSSGTDSVVPVQVQPTKSLQMVNHSTDNNYLEIDFSSSKLNSFNNNNNNNNIYTAQCFSQSMSSSSVDVGIVPDGSSMSEISYPFGKIEVDVGGSVLPNNGTVQGLDREARVLRYREKRKNRKFEKTIRYASRKAYAETRPRIKGRFAKRTDAEPEVDVMNRMFSSGSSAFMADAIGYGVVPSF